MPPNGAPLVGAALRVAAVLALAAPASVPAQAPTRVPPAVAGAAPNVAAGPGAPRRPAALDGLAPPRSRARRAALGAVLGGLAGGALGYAMTRGACDACDDAAPLYAGAALGAGVGALAGVGVALATDGSGRRVVRVVGRAAPWRSPGGAPREREVTIHRRAGPGWSPDHLPAAIPALGGPVPDAEPLVEIGSERAGTHRHAAGPPPGHPHVQPPSAPTAMRRPMLPLTVLLLAACGGSAGEQKDAASAAAAGQAAPAAGQAAPPASAGQQASPRDTARGTVGGVNVLVDYGRPSKRGRVIFAATGLAPYGRVWRTGANAATTLVTSGPLRVGQTRLPAGTYTLYTIPGPDRWQLVINRQTGQWGTDYDQTQDLARIPMQVTALSTPVEQFTIAVEPAALVMRWDTVQASAALSADGG